MGYAFILFGVVLIMSVVMVTAYNYGVAKDSQVAPLKAENAYGGRETGKAQTTLTIVNTCLRADGSQRYTRAKGTELVSGPYSLYLTVRNNGSTVLNSTKATVLYNTSYKNFKVTKWQERWTEWERWHIIQRNTICRREDDDYDNRDYRLWYPLTYVCMMASNIYINTPNLPAPGPEIRLSVAAENGVATIAPTTPTNFTGWRDGSETLHLSWNASYDADGVAYYRLYNNTDNDCKQDDHDIFLKELPGNSTSYVCDHHTCDKELYYLTAVDTLLNEGVQSRALYCKDDPNIVCITND